jgi:predicted small lipoprotein YifL
MRLPDPSFRSRPSLPLALALGAVLVLGGCGQSGDLYLPDEKSTAPAAPTAALTGDAEQEERKDEAPAPPPPATTAPSTTPTTP